MKDVAMQSTDEAIAEINRLGYLVQDICQLHFGGWQVTLRSPFAWGYHYAQGATLLLAATNAATAARQLGEALAQAKAQREAQQSRRRQRQRLEKTQRRVRLRERVRL